MKRYLLSVSTLLLLAACQMQEEYVPVESGFTAEIEEFAGETRTSLNESNSVVWSENDRIAVFQGCTVADLFEVSAASAGKTTGSFKEVTSEGGGGFESGNEIPDNVAIYPYMEGLECASGMFSDEDAYVYKIENVYYPRIQVYQENSFPDDAFVMVAVTSGVKDNKLRFRNASGALRLRIKGDATVKSISIEGNADEPLGGYAVLKAYRDGSAPELESFGTSYGTVTLDCGSGVRLDEDTATEFIIALPPTDFEKGFTVTIHPKDGEPDVRMTEKRNSVRRSRILNMPEIVFGVPEGPSTGDAVDLNSDGQTANSYIISEAGTYRFAAVKGNSSESVGDVASVEVLWESFGTDVTPSVGDLVKEVSYSDGYILFSTPSSFQEGNAVIAAKNSSGTILWSWHIWLTDEPEGQVYYNNAGTMMDRNLGATSATPGEVGALGLLYQWGRKDPFLGSSTISGDIDAKSTGSWPSRVYSSSSRGTIEYAVKNPMTFIKYNSYNGDWYYTGSSSTDNTRWESEKTTYDPCPAGWRVPDGGSNGVWSKALGSASSYYDTYDDSREGINFSGRFGNASPIWYPASGFRSSNDGSLGDVGNSGYYWSVTPNSYYAYSLGFGNYGNVYPSINNNRAYGLSVRCFKEGSSTPPTETPKEYENLSAEGTANSYIVSQAGDYKFETVKGNSSTSVGSVSEVEVLWESFGTDVTPSVGDLVKEVSYSDGYILFSTPSSFQEGNAVIAAKNSSGTILWSWHIWLTDEPEGQVYYKGAGTMMDRNLGATSAEPGDVGALGLLYQWGRKDPFLGSSDISNNTIAESTGSWPSAVSSSSSRGTVEYAVKNPMTFIKYNSYNGDWYYTGSSSTDNTRWESEKTIYDPCPAGWRVPDGGAYGVWSKALGSSSSYYDTYDDSREGINFSGRFGNASPIWYPASAYRSYDGGSLLNVGYYGNFWSVTPLSYYAYYLYFNYYGNVDPSVYNYRANGQSVRCLQE